MDDKLLMEGVFYSKPFFFSYSSINKLLYSPRSFYNHYVLGQKEDYQSVAMVEGSLIHCLLLESTNFNKQFVIAQSKVPSEKVMAVIESIYNIYKSDLINDEVIVRPQLEDYKDEILSAMDSVEFHEKIKDKEIRLSKVINPVGEEYFKFLITRENKILIDSTTYGKCVEIVEKLKTHAVYTDYLGLDLGSTRKTANEVKVSYKEDEAEYGLKGVIDNISIDENKKIIYINDIKTTSKSLSEFEDTVEYHKYWIQAAIYDRLVRYELKVDETWKCIFTFIVIDAYGQIYPFEVSEDTMTRWQIELQDILKIVNYHYSQKEYDLPYKFCKSKITL